MTSTSQASDAPKTVELNAGDVVDDRYRIVRRLGQGGMGTVYEAQQVKLDRLVALKVLRPDFAKNETSAKRFEREARAASTIDHRNVVKIYDFGHLPTGELYYTMELMQGSDLAQLLRENGALPWSRAGWIILQVVRAFAAIHEQDIVHRDIKPANCFMLAPKAGDEPDFVKILDFGIANLQEDEAKAALTGTSDILGSVFYMAPEQVNAEPVDSRTDIYSLGIMMYELLTGDVPFRDQNAYKVMQAHLEKAPVPPRELKPDIPLEVANLIMCALSKSPEDRPQAMTDIEKALVPLVVVPGTIEGKRTAPRAGTSMRFRDTYALKLRRRWLSMVVAAVVLFVVALALTRLIKEWMERTQGPGPEIVVSNELTEEERAKLKNWILLLPEKEYDLFADPFGHASLAGLKVRDRSGVLVSLEGLLPPEPWNLERGRVAGEILNDRQRPLAEASVCLWLVDPEAPAELRRRPACAQTDRQGHFEHPEVAPGYYDVVVLARSFLPQSYFERNGSPLVLLPTGSERIEMTLEAGGVEVRGVVKNKLGDRLEKAKVAVVGPVRAVAETNKAGEFSLWVAPEDQFSLVAWAAEHADAVESGMAEQEFAFSLSKESKLAGTVIDEVTGEPIQGARVRATPNATGLDPLVYTDSKGAFMIPGLVAGEYVPEARTDDGYGPTQWKDGAYRADHIVTKVWVPEGGAAGVEIKLRRSTNVAIVEKEDDPPPASTSETDDVGTDGLLTTVGTDSAPTVDTDSTPTAGTDSASTVDTDAVPIGDTDAVLTMDPGPAGPVEPVPPGPVEPVPPGPVEPTPPGPVEPDPPEGPGSSAGDGSETKKRVGSSKPKDKDLPRRKKLYFGLKACGKGKKGKITVMAALVFNSGELKNPRVVVTGEAVDDSAVKECAEELVNSFRLLPRDDNEVSTFKSLVVEL